MSVKTPKDVTEPEKINDELPQQPKESKRSHKTIIIIICVLVALILAAITWYFFFNNRPVPVKDTATITPSSGKKDTTPVPSAAIRCADSYSAFADRSVGMAFCYPSSWGTATVHDALVAPTDTGHRQSITFSANPFFSVGGTSDDWSTTVGRDTGCLEPNNVTVAASAYNTSWHDMVGSGADVEFATRSLPAPAGGYDSTETVSNILQSGVCAQAHKVISGSRYRVAFTAFYHDFAEASGIVTPSLHIDHPDVLFSVEQRQQFDAVLASLVAY